LFARNSSFHRRDDKLSRARPFRPARGDGFDLGEEAHAFAAMLVGIAKGRALPAAKAVIG